MRAISGPWCAATCQPILVFRLYVHAHEPETIYCIPIEQMPADAAVKPSCVFTGAARAVTSVGTA